MNTFKKHGVKRSLALVLTAAMAWFLIGPVLAAAEDGESDICRKALAKCIAEAIVSGLLSMGATIVFFVSFCLVGYDFCLKYIDNYV